MKKSPLFIAVIFSFVLLISIPLKNYAQSSFDKAKITDSSFNAFLSQWERYVDSTASGNPTFMKENASHSNDITIMGAFGGYEKGWDKVGARLDWAAAQMKGNEPKKAKVEYINIVVSGDLAFTVAVAGSVQGNTISEKDRPIRVTEIFRKENGSWKLLHRHADPLIEKKAPTAPAKQ
ncbi:MAG: nuclear transport factor 2 family protein [Ferruginibacter sp.]